MSKRATAVCISCYVLFGFKNLCAELYCSARPFAGVCLLAQYSRRAAKCQSRRLVVHARRQKGSKFLALFILCNIAGAELVQKSALFPDPSSDEQSLYGDFFDGQYASRPCGHNAVSADGRLCEEGFRLERYEENFCAAEVLTTSTAGANDNHSISSSRCQPAPSSDLAVRRADQPRFEELRCTSQEFSDSGDNESDTIESDIGEADGDLVGFVELASYRSRFEGAIPYAPSTPFPFCSNAKNCVSWFAEAPVRCGRHWRVTALPPERFDDVGQYLNEVWQDQCDGQCSIVAIEQSEALSMYAEDALTFIVYKHQAFRAAKVFLMVAEHQLQTTNVRYEYRACRVPFLADRRVLHDVLRTFGQYEEESDVSETSLRHGSVVRLQTRSFSPLQGPQSMQNQHAASHLPRSGGDGSDFQSLMQVSALIPDLINLYISELPRSGRFTEVIVWFHAADRFRQIAQEARTIAFDAILPGAPQIRGAWDHVLGRRSCFVFPVRPRPFFGLNQQHNAILTTFRGDDLFPVLLDYHSDHTRVRGTFVFRFTGFPSVSEIFAQAIPQNRCVWDAECKVKFFDALRTHVYSWGERVPLREGLYIFLSEYLFSDSEESQVSTCDDGNDESESSHQSTARSSEELEDDVSHLMHLFTVEEDRDIEAYVISTESRGLPRSGAAFLGELHIRLSDVQSQDVVRPYVRTVYEIPDQAIGVAQIWIAHSSVALHPRLAVFQPTRSFTQAIVQAVEDVTSNEDFLLALVYPRLPPLTLRVWPIDFVGLTHDQLRQWKKRIVVDVVSPRMPRRVSVLSEHTFLCAWLVEQIGLSEVCAPTLHVCTLRFSSEHGDKVWSLDEWVDVPHATGLQLDVVPVEASLSCRIGKGNTATLSRAASDWRGDLSSTMQMSSQLSNEHMLIHYLQQIEGQSEVVLWFHRHSTAKSVCAVSRSVARNRLCSAGAIWRVPWPDGPPSCWSYVAVDPMPQILEHERPMLILFAAVMPMMKPFLVECRVQGHVYMRTYLGDVADASLVGTIFDEVCIGHSCHDHHCFAIVRGISFQLGEVLRWMPGDFVQLYEHAQASTSSTSACSSLEGEPPSSFATSSAGETVGSEFEASGGNTATPDEVSSLMQLPLQDGISQVSHFHAEGSDILYASYGVARQSDVLSDYISIALGEGPPIRRAVTWVVLAVHDILWKQRFVDYAPPRSLTIDLLAAWADEVDEEPLGLAIERESGFGAPERAFPHIVGTTMNRLRLGYRVYLITALVGPIPRKFATLCARNEKASMIFSKSGHGSLCDARECFLVARRQGRFVTWRGDEQIDEPHGSSFALTQNYEETCEQTLQSRDSVDQPASLEDVRTLSDDHGLMQTSSFFVMPRSGCASSTELVDPAYSTDELFLMQRPQDGSEAESASIDDTSEPTQPTSISADASFGPHNGWVINTRNTDFDWISVWTRVKQYLAEYCRADVHRRNQQLVHVILCRGGSTTTCGAYCPAWVLEPDRSYRHVCDWCQEYTCSFDHDFTRAFPVAVELYQNMPSVVVVQHLENDIMPLVVQVDTDSHMVHVVLMAQRWEYISEIIDWAHTRTAIRFPFRTFYQGNRVDYWARVPVTPGAVLQIRSRTDRDLDNPEPSTLDTGTSLEFVTHTTWSSQPSDEPANGLLALPEHESSLPCLAADEHSHEDDEHTLLQFEGGRIDSGHDVSSAGKTPEIGEIDYPRESPCAAIDSKRRRQIGVSVPFPASHDGSDSTSLFQTVYADRTAEWVRRPAVFLADDEALVEERDRFLAWRRKVDHTRTTTSFLYFESFQREALAFLAARDQWPDFVLYSTMDDRVVHWELAVDEFFVMEKLDFTTVLRDFVRSTLPFDAQAAVIPVRPLPEVFEQQGADDLFLLIDQDPLVGEIPVFVSRWVQEGDRQPELFAHRLPKRIATDVLLQLYELEEVCMHEMYICRVSHYAQELPVLIAWQPYPGMKIDIRVSRRHEQFCVFNAVPRSDGPLMHLGLLGLLDESDVDREQDDSNEHYDDTSLMMSQQIATVRGLEFRYAQAKCARTWHQVLTYPPFTSYIFQSHDIMKSQLRSILAWEHSESIEMTFWCFKEGSMKSEPPMKRKLGSNSWTETYAEVSQRWSSDLSMSYILVTQRPSLFGRYDSLGVHSQWRKSLLYYFLVEIDLKQCWRKDAIACPLDCTFEHVISSLDLERCGTAEIAITGVTPRDEQLYLPGSRVNLPSGSFLKVSNLPVLDLACDDVALDAGEHVEEADRQMFLQLSMHIKYQYDVFERLPPPGNTTWWFSQRMDCMDDWESSGQHEWVFDAVARPRSLLLAPLLPISEEVNENTVRSDGRVLKLADHLVQAASTPGFCLSLPDFQPLVDSLMCKPPYTAVPREIVLKHLPDDLTGPF